mgnify:CR=1 FL=1
MRLADIGIDVDQLPGERNDWNDEGVVLLPGALSDHEEALADYERVWTEDCAGRHPEGWMQPDGGWPDPTPYMRRPEIIRMLAPLADTLEEVLGGPAGLHLNLTGWQTTERDWHADQYLNPPHVGDHYVALWLALEPINPDSGPFQYVPGSHRWPQVTQEKIWELLGTYDARKWPKESERILTPVYEAEVAESGCVTYLPQHRGDVLLWHGRLCHRGSKAKVPGMQRKAFIAHLSRVDSRPDMPAPAVQHESGLWYFPIGADRCAD